MRLPIALSLVMLLSGCAFSVYDVNVDYKYDNPIETDLSSIALDVGEFKDSRNVDNPRMIMNQKNGYGQTTTGGWQAEKPLIDIVKDAVIDGLKKSGVTLNENSQDMVLSAELLEFDGDIKMGAWVGSYVGKMSVKMQLVDKQSGEIIWRDTFVGSGEAKGNEGVASVLKISLDNLVDNLLNDKYFIQKVSGK
ncbi:hypothetical protein SAMN02927930_02055 [Pseudidiomarina indica]|uniref:Lipoprotein n=1 Tax=Pseudidiomarina indica TaxID=1159017 RepID=A0A1G6E451_9GAMM|nr:hypothetical protein [Pseudidiomarina indica]SDB52142.1 hypothetical protein SAMN02927930_02055 [Pseudidiomarina indica]